jgi:hypothetical protein
MQRIVVTLFASYAANTKREACFTAQELADLIRRAMAASKEALPWLKLARFGDQRTAAGSLRHDGNMLAITGIEADYDAKVMPFEAAVQVLRDAGLAAIVYTSPSFAEDAPKWRVLCFLSTEYLPGDRDQYMARVNGLFGGVFDRVSWTRSQSYYFGSVQRNPSHRVVVVEGVCIDQADWLDAIAIGRPEEPSRGEPPRPASRSEDITDARLRGLFDSLLDNVRSAGEGEKHFALWRIGKAVGGHLHHPACPWGEAEAIEQLLGALPAGVKDWVGARRTAADAIQAGQQQPLELEERPRDPPVPMDRLERVAALWAACVPLAGTVAGAWLEIIGLGHLVRCPELRFHSACPHPSGLRLPALVAAVRDIGGTLTAVARSYVRADGSGLADIEPQRAAMGAVMGGAIRLSSVEEVVAASELVVAVDLEEAAALGLLMNRPAWATGIVQNLGGRDGIGLPPEVRRVAIVTTGADGAARSAWFRFRRQGREAGTFIPPHGAHGYVELLRDRNTGRDAA